MLKLSVKGVEMYDEATSQFISTKDTTLCLEHSLISLSKWESKWHKPFLSKGEKTEEEFIDYVRCMTITQNVDPLVYRCLTNEDWGKIQDYISDSMSATTFNEKKRGKSRQQLITSELIYSWMVTLQIPFECEKWHLNRLLTLIRVCDIENSPKKKMKTGDVYKQNAQLNQARRKMMNSKG